MDFEMFALAAATLLEHRKFLVSNRNGRITVPLRALRQDTAVGFDPFGKVALFAADLVGDRGSSCSSKQEHACDSMPRPL